MKRSLSHKIAWSLLFCFSMVLCHAQRKGNILQGIGDRAKNIGGMGSSGGGNDTLTARNKFEDSLTVTIFYLDSTRAYKLDSSINDFTKRYPIPATHIYLGNTGTATRSIVFAPSMRAGWDPGFHALDVYKWRLDKVQFYNTTRPYTELGYMLGAKAEQIIEVLLTRNIRPNWNVAFHYRLINSSGIFRNQRTNHSNSSFTSWYQSRNKRYNNYVVFLGNRLQSGESGGIKNDQDYLNLLDYAKDRNLIPTNIGGDAVTGNNFFSTALGTGNRYRESNILVRQQYDLGKKDSLVNDSTVIPLFYPRLRFEHTFRYGKYNYSFQDFPTFTNTIRNTPDSLWYITNYKIRLPHTDSLFFFDRWEEISNDFSIYQFPDIKNGNQYIKLGAELQLLKGRFYRDSVDLSRVSLSNVIAHGEYRNLTKNKKWEMLAFGRFWLAGYNIGNYHAYVSLQRLASKLGSFQLGFENVNRSPSFIYDQRSGFYLDTPKDFKNENTSHAFASLFISKLGLQLGGDYYLVGNYLYLKNYYQLQQESTIFNVLRINAYKTFRIGRRWNLRSEVYLQQKAGNADVNIPLLYTRNRFMYEGNFGFKNLNVATGLEVRYHTPYKADNYSPIPGQFFYQDSVTINNLPDVHLFLHFRIRGFTAYVRAENLNTARIFGGFQFNNNNLAAPGYPTPGLNLRFGIYWSFVN